MKPIFSFGLLASVLLTAPLLAAPLTLANSNFQASGNNTNPASWTVTENNATSISSIYVWGSTSNVLAFWGAGATAEQSFLTPEATAGTYGSYAITFDTGWRGFNSPTATGFSVKFELVNVTDGGVLATGTYNYPLPPAAISNTYTTIATGNTLILAYDNSLPSLAGDTVALRVTGTGSPNQAGNNFLNTGWIDNITVDATAGGPDPILTITAPPTIQSNGTPVNVAIPFSNEGATQPLTITSVTPGGFDAPAFTVGSTSSPVAPGGSGTINLTFTPTFGGNHSADITVVTNAAVNPTRVIPLTARVADPAMSLATERVDFGTLAANPGATTANVTVTNNGGTASLNVNASLLGTADGFAITSVPGPIAPGASANIVVTFNPGSATGHFGGLLAITSDAAYNSSVTLPLVAEVTPATPLPIPLSLENGDFNANAYSSTNSTAPNGWTSSLVGSSGNYGQLIPNVTNLPALFWARSGNFLQQDLSVANTGLTASQITGVSLSFDRGYRNDTVTAGDIIVRVSLWDLVSDTEIAGRDVLIEDTGVIAGTGSNQFTPTGVAFPVASASAGAVALRIATVEPLLAANQFFATAMIDNVSLAISGTYVPADPFADWALAAGIDGTPGKEDGPADDPDQDGVTNLDEFAFGSAPLSGSSRGLVAALTADTNADSQDELLLTVAVRAGASFSGSPSPAATIDGIVYQIQGSISLGAFTQTVEGPLATPVIPASLPAAAPSGYEYKTFRLAGSNGLPGRGFLRASVTEAP
jgi:Protein of unknown function (DUF1573)